MLAFLFNSIAFHGAKTVAASVNAKDTAVTLRATITGTELEVEEDTDGIDREYWKTDVTYTYNGIEYSGVHYDNLKSEPQLGKTVSVRIDPDAPGKLLPFASDTVISAILSPIFLTAVTAALYLMIKSVLNWLAEMRGWQDQGRCKAFALLFLGIKLAAESLVFYLVRASLVYAVFSLIAAVLFWLLVLRKTEKAQQKPHGQFA
ncbi:MAG: DUF3592 domain-containing protein [Oscillospiraceae bacterium]|nr:DUF3592 domain-containing protein [Oscillospiraceae bacterium]